jgi:hypothetical protein
MADLDTRDLEKRLLALGSAWKASVGEELPILAQAAAAIAAQREEIERLTNEVATLDHSRRMAEEETMEQARLNGMGAERELALRAEIESVRAYSRSHAETMAAYAIDLQAEIERLRGLVEEASYGMKSYRVFVECREKAHPHGVDLYNELIARLDAALSPPKEAI